MIGGILRYSRAGRRDLGREDVFRVAKVLVQEVITLLAPNEQAVVRTVGELPTLSTERVPLQQVFMNLVGNALKYAKRADVVVEITCRELERNYYEFSVRDNGPGIALDNQPQIWELFPARSADTGSTGIGLAVVKKTVGIPRWQSLGELRPRAGLHVPVHVASRLASAGRHA